MKRTLLTTVLAVTLAFNCFSQSTPASITYKGAPKPGLVLELPNGTDIAEGTILQKLKENGYTPETKGTLFWKKNKLDGFYVFNGVKLPSLNSQTLDLYFKVEPKSRKDKNNSVLSLLVSKGYDNFVSETDTATYDAAKGFLDSFVENSAAFRLNLDIKAQEESVKKAEAKLNDARGAETKMNKQIEELQSKIKTSQTDQQALQAELDGQKKKLEDLRGQAVAK